MSSASIIRPAPIVRPASTRPVPTRPQARKSVNIGIGDKTDDDYVDEEDNDHGIQTTAIKESTLEEKYALPAHVRQATKEELIEMFHGSRKILNHDPAYMSAACRECLDDVYFDVNIRARVDRMVFQTLLIHVPSLKPWGASRSILDDIEVAIRAAEMMFEQSH